MNAFSTIQPQRQAQMSWQIIEMARSDGPRSLNPESFVARTTRGLFGIEVPGGLANEGLEALRRFSVRAWFWDFVPATEVQQFLDAGYSESDAKRILAYVAHHRGFTPTLLLSPA